MPEGKFIIVTGGVLSGLGKGITTSSVGLLLKMQGYNVTAIKIDPYLSCDAGTMNPFQHGEVFVLEDGGEVDLDLGNYERFLDVNLSSDNNITTGRVYKAVIEKERRSTLANALKNLYSSKGYDCQIYLTEPGPGVSEI